MARSRADVNPSRGGVSRYFGVRRRMGRRGHASLRIGPAQRGSARRHRGRAVTSHPAPRAGAWTCEVGECHLVELARICAGRPSRDEYLTDDRRASDGRSPRQGNRERLRPGLGSAAQKVACTAPRSRNCRPRHVQPRRIRRVPRRCHRSSPRRRRFDPNDDSLIQKGHAASQH